MKYKLKALSLSAVIALLFLLSACDYALSPPAEPTPNLQPTIDALVDQRLAERDAATKAKGTSETLNVALVPTPTPMEAGLLAFPPVDDLKLERCAGEDPRLKVLPSLVEINALTYDGAVSGSGFIVGRERGFILTATHVVADVKRDTITVTYRDGVVEPAIWVAREPAADISLLYAHPTGFPSLRVASGIKEALAESGGGFIADRIRYLAAIGAVDGSYVTGAGETLALTVDNAGWRNITVSTSGEHGMSGGPLVDLCGGLVGIVSLGGDGQNATLTALGLDQDYLAKLMSYGTSYLETTPTPTLEPPTPSATGTPAPTPTPEARFSSTEAVHRLRLYFEEQYGIAVEEETAWLNYAVELMSNPADQFTLAGNPELQERLRLGMARASAQVEAWYARHQGTMYAEYSGKGAWLITVKDIDIDGIVHNFSEQWWLFERSNTLPMLKE